ncbi:MAG: OmpH family outer membrane protein [Puniceicoccales bacterium]|jgi:Skp family chaperone for outer membrane proteins|nr:OmpH family outer membrane protein [Puniceicoccales bacterium]
MKNIRKFSKVGPLGAVHIRPFSNIGLPRAASIRQFSRLGLLGTAILLAVEGSAVGTEPAPAACSFLSFDASRVMGSYAMAQSRNGELEAMAKNLQQDGQKKMEELVSARKEIQEAAEKIDNPALTDEAREKMRAEVEKKADALHEKEMNLQRWREDSENRLGDTRSELLSKTIDELRVIASEIAQEKGATLVVNRTNPDILYAAPATDISDEMSTRLNRRYPVTAPAVASPAK